MEEIVVITADLASLGTNPRVVEHFERRRYLREEPGLHLLCDFQFVGSATFGFQFLGNRTASRFYFPIYLVPSRERKGVSVRIFEDGEHSTPSRCLRRMRKANSAL